MTPARFPYVARDPTYVPQSLAPLMPLTLARGSRSLPASALVDSGASLNVLPLGLGLQLGAVWDQQAVDVQLAGTLTGVPAKGLVLATTVGPSPPVQLVFAWANTDRVPLLLGQTNFFAEFEVCFFRAQSAFEVKPK
jgi:hypothetical protein